MTRFNTQLVHGLPVNDNNTGAVNPPIYNSSTYAVESVNAMPRWDYARSGNPTRDFLEKQIAQLEHGTSRLRVRVRTRRDSRGAVHLQTRGPHRGRQEHLRRHVFAVQRVLRRAWAGVRQRRHRRLQGARRRDQRARQRRPRGQRRIFRDADQPAAADQQRQPHLGHRAPIRRAVHRRQHVRHPVPAAAARFGRGYRHPFGHQIPGRPFRGERRPCGGVGR